MRDFVSSLIEAAGLACLVAAGFLISAVVGLVALGFALILVGLAAS